MTLDQLIKEIDPANTFDNSLARADKALNSFRHSRAVVDNIDQFEELMSTFFCHIDAVLLNARDQSFYDREFFLSRCETVLKDLYGPRGKIVAYDMAHTGKQGGLLTIMKSVSLRQAEIYAKNMVSNYVEEYWRQADPDQIFSDCEKYLQKYGHLLPIELTEGSGARVKANFRQILKQHPQILRNTRKVGR